MAATHDADSLMVSVNIVGYEVLKTNVLVEYKRDPEEVHIV